MPQIPDALRETLETQYESYVLITCGAPSERGEMNVEMSYEGDAALVAYMINGAQEILDVEDE